MSLCRLMMNKSIGSENRLFAHSRGGWLRGFKYNGEKQLTFGTHEVQRNEVMYIPVYNLRQTRDARFLEIWISSLAPHH